MTTEEHLICIGLGSLSIFAGFFFKLLLHARLFRPLVEAAAKAAPDADYKKENWFLWFSELFLTPKYNIFTDNKDNEFSQKNINCIKCFKNQCWAKN